MFQPNGQENLLDAHAVKSLQFPKSSNLNKKARQRTHHLEKKSKVMNLSLATISPQFQLLEKPIQGVAFHGGSL